MKAFSTGVKYKDFILVILGRDKVKLGIMFSLGMFAFNTASTSGNNSGFGGTLMGAGPPSLVVSEAMKNGLSPQNM